MFWSFYLPLEVCRAWSSLFSLISSCWTNICCLCVYPSSFYISVTFALDLGKTPNSSLWSNLDFGLKLNILTRSSLRLLSVSLSELELLEKPLIALFLWFLNSTFYSFVRSKLMSRFICTWTFTNFRISKLSSKCSANLFITLICLLF